MARSPRRGARLSVESLESRDVPAAHDPGQLVTDPTAFDRFVFLGHGWTVASHVEDVTPDEMMRRMTELFG